MADTVHSPPASTGYEIYRTSTAPSLDETAHMEVTGMNPEFEAGIAKALEAGFAEGNIVKTLFSRPGFSLTYAWFKSGFPLPLHTHNADCLYYIVAGSLQLALIGCRASADDVADAGKQVLEDVGAEDGLAGDEPEVAGDALAFDAGGGRDDHERVPRPAARAAGLQPSR